jgi:predicted transcriptional regulator
MLMAKSTKTTSFSVRIDEETERALESLTAESTSRNAAIAEAIHETYRAHVYERARRESEALRDNPEYQAEIKAARTAMGSDDAW